MGSRARATQKQMQVSTIREPYQSMEDHFYLNVMVVLLLNSVVFIID